MKLARFFRRSAPALVVFALLTVRPAHAVSKEIIELQTQVQQLIDSLARMQQSNDQQMGVLKDLVQQTVDSVNKMAISVNGMQLKLQNQGDAQSTRNDQLSGQVQALNDSVDELKARMQRMEKTLGDLQSQAQSANAILGNLPGANGSGAAPSPGSPVPAGAPPAGAGNAAPCKCPSGSSRSVCGRDVPHRLRRLHGRQVSAGGLGVQRPHQGLSGGQPRGQRILLHRRY